MNHPRCDPPDTSVTAATRRALGTARAVGDRHLIGIALQPMARLELTRGSPADALAYAMESLRNAEAIGYVEGVIGALHDAAHALTANGQVDDAHAMHVRALQLASHIGHTAAMCEAIEGIAIAAAARNDAATAATLLTAVDSERERQHLHRRPDDDAEVAELRLAIKGSRHTTVNDSDHHTFDQVVDQCVGRDVA